MPSQREQPPADARQFVEALWFAERDFAADGGFLVTPDRFAELLFFDAAIDACEGARRERLSAVTLLGPLVRPVRLEAAGRVRSAGVRLRAWAAGPLIGSSAGPLAGSTADVRPWSDARSAIGPAADRVVVAFRDGRPADVFDALRSIVVRQLSPVLGACDLAALTPAEEPLTTAELSRRLGVGRRQAERRFRALTRLSPGQFASVARFQQVRDALWADPGQPLACAAGYADQPHMTREFRRYTGVTPARFASWCRRQQPPAGVAIVQDPPARAS